MTAPPAILVQGVRQTFGDVVALDGLDVEVQGGTVFGLLGPDGAGKTRLVRVLATLLRPTAGRARVLGRDVVADPLAVRWLIGFGLAGPAPLSEVGDHAGLPGWARCQNRRCERPDLDGGPQASDWTGGRRVRAPHARP